ncbi:hypothetical protein Q9Q94_15330 [Uliginosibacterium sp. 31-16]|uniref:hypothetical protein n=1 Tax=Uliginosibacterium sp. 31-16 TaxID=3068315 RepID=UPI00273D770A|nr:hypothetical protein [Uliginosibacterium sp. 31-16]MDP5240913.1 hypothetical protein [Uliginosibacterium sp. 31-16]
MEISTSDAIASASLLVSLGAAFFAKLSSKKANQIAQENLKLQHGMVELEISQSIENAKSKINEISIIMVPFISKERLNKITKEESETLDLYRKNFNAATQTLINYYDAACSKYIDEKVDKVRFKKTYKNEIRKLVENEDLKEYFNPLTSPYKPILNIYSEWEHLE